MLLIIIFIMLFYLNLNVHCEEFCIYDTFKTHCEQNEVVFIEEAVYGREKYGKCILIEDEPDEFIRQRKGFIGCFSDVKHIIEPRCAGRQSCELIVSKIQVETNCSKSLLKYLNVDYSCLRGLLVSFYRLF